jgi:hypothetical protein
MGVVAAAAKKLPGTRAGQIIQCEVDQSRFAGAMLAQARWARVGAA